MAFRFVVTGAGRCETAWMAQAFSHAGVPCGTGQVFNSEPDPVWPEGLRADSSWLAATRTDKIDVPVVLLVRHPMVAVRDLSESGFFAEHGRTNNPGHTRLAAAFPAVYEHVTVRDQALQMWVSLTRAALGRAELVVRVEQLDAGLFGRILGWAGADPGMASQVLASNWVCDQHEAVFEPDWDLHSLILRRQARELAATLGYPELGGLTYL